jgi:hypothetical protein
MPVLKKGDLLTRVARYNLIRDGRMLYIDVHETLHGKLAAPFVAVPNLVNIVARPEYQGTGMTEAEALDDALEKIAEIPFENIFPGQKPQSPDTGDTRNG